MNPVEIFVILFTYGVLDIVVGIGIGVYISEFKSGRVK